MAVRNSSLVYLRPASLAYVRVTGPYETSIPKAWDLMFDWLDQHGFSTPHGRGFGLARDNPSIVGPAACRYDACITITPNLESRAMRELGIMTLPGGPFARIRRTGCYDNVRALVSDFYTTYQPPEGLRLDNRRPLVTIYFDDPRRVEPSDQRSEMCIPLTTEPASPATVRKAASPALA